MPTAEQRADHAHDYRKHEPSPRHQKRAVSVLVGYCWGLMGSGVLGAEVEKQLRARIRTVCIEFDMEPPPEPTKAAAISCLMLREPV